jgi:glyoxylase-like metal-dependent hydrolase (beta-lactamase superfamily II)
MEAVFGSTRPPRLHRLTRRQLLVDLGWGGVAVAVLAGCSTPTPSNPTPTAPPPTTTSPGTTSSSATAATTAAGGQMTWSRANLGFVSAYVLVRGTQAAVVDTGVAGSADAIGSALQSAGSSWDAVTDLVLTHHHGDHAGSLAEVAARATKATVHAGAADIGQMTSPRTIVAAADGAEIFGLQVVATPGHTLGHISVLDRATRVLVAGDALNNSAGLTGSSPRNTADADQAKASVKKLAALDLAGILFGHGEPITADASAALRQYAGTL